MAYKGHKKLINKNARENNISVVDDTQKNMFNSYLLSERKKKMDCKYNFGNLYGTCAGRDRLDEEDHLFVCPILIEEVHDVTFNNVYRDIDVQ